MESFLVTRSRMQAEGVCNFLTESGYEVISEPLCDVEFLKYKGSEVENFKKGEVQAILITSFNVSNTFLDFKFDKKVKIFAIGEKTVEKIRQNGYENIIIPESSSVLELEKVFLREVTIQTGKILYFCGNYLTRDLSLSLAKYKFNVKNIVAYLVKYHDKFSLDFLNLIEKKKIDNMLCYSKNNVRCVAGLIKRHDLWDYFSDLNVIAISEEVTRELISQGFKKVKNFGDYEFLMKYYKNYDK